MHKPFLTTAGGQIQCQRCQARNRLGNQCGKPAIRGKRVCRNHGGASTGPKSEAGKARIREASLVHGRRSEEGKVKATEAAAQVRALEDALIVLGAIPEGSRTRGVKPRGYRAILSIDDVRRLLEGIRKESQPGGHGSPPEIIDR
jgi:hypothetical protein